VSKRVSRPKGHGRHSKAGREHHSRAGRKVSYVVDLRDESISCEERDKEA